MHEIEGTYFHVRVLIGMVVGLAIWTRSPLFHGAFAVVALAYQLLWLVRMNASVF